MVRGEVDAENALYVLAGGQWGRLWAGGYGRDTTAPALTAIADGWTVGATCIRQGGWAMLALAPSPAAAWQSGQVGNVTDIALCTVQDGFRPAQPVYSANSSNAILGGVLNTNGVATLTSTAGGLSAATTTARWQFVYPLA